MGLNKIRYHFLDEARGFAVLCMVFYHAFYTMAWMFNMPFGETLLNFFAPAEPFFAAFFIFLSGVCCQLSRSNLKRGLKLAVVSILLTVITVIVLPRFNFEGAEIYFGILHLLSVGMLLVALLNKVIKAIPIYLGAVVFMLLFLLFYNVENGYIGFGEYKYLLPSYLYYKNLFVLGFHSDTFYSADYFPILPWLFIFFSGAFIGLLAKAKKFPAFFRKKRVPPLAFLGRHALIVYLVHQPVIYGLLFGVNYIIMAMV